MNCDAIPQLPAIIALSRSEIETFLQADGVKRINTLLPSCRWFDPLTSTLDDWRTILETIKPQIIVSAWKTPRLPPWLPTLKYVCHFTGSLRAVLPRELMARGVMVSNWGDVAGPLVAEHALLLTLGALRSMPRWASFFAENFDHEDTNKLQASSLRGRRVAIHGFGRIARELIQLLRPFQVEISAFSAGVPIDFIESHAVRPARDLHDLAADADVFITCEALTEITRGSIDESVLSALPSGAVFVNVGRGAVVDESALALVALKNHLRVASDVFTIEPLPDDSPLRTIAGALYSPHIGGPTLDWYPRCGEMALNNLERFLNGYPPNNQLTLEQFDRST